MVTASEHEHAKTRAIVIAIARLRTTLDSSPLSLSEHLGSPGWEGLWLQHGLFPETYRTRDPSIMVCE